MNYLTLAIQLITAVLDHLTQISELVKASGGQPLTPDQWRALVDSDTKARGALSDALNAVLAPTIEALTKPPAPPAPTYPQTPPPPG